MHLIRTDEDARHAEWLFRLGYDLLGGKPEATLIAAISLQHVSGMTR